jgi:hypothetical protein
MLRGLEIPPVPDLTRGGYIREGKVLAEVLSLVSSVAVAESTLNDCYLAVDHQAVSASNVARTYPLDLKILVALDAKNLSHAQESCG